MSKSGRILLAHPTIQVKEDTVKLLTGIVAIALFLLIWREYDSGGEDNHLPSKGSPYPRGRVVGGEQPEVLRCRGLL